MLVGEIQSRFCGGGCVSMWGSGLEVDVQTTEGWNGSLAVKAQLGDWNPSLVWLGRSWSGRWLRKSGVDEMESAAIGAGTFPVLALGGVLDLGMTLC